MEENIEIKPSDVEEYTDYPTSDGDLMYEEIRETL